MKKNIILFSLIVLWAFIFFPAEIACAASDRVSSNRFFSQGASLMQRGDHPNAMLFFEKAIQADSSNPMPYLVIGDYYFRSDNYAKAIPYYEAFLGINSPEMLQYGAEIYKRTGDSYLNLTVKSLVLQDKKVAQDFARKGAAAYRSALDRTFTNDAERKISFSRLAMAHLYDVSGSKETSAKIFASIEKTANLTDTPEYFYFKGYFLKNNGNNREAEKLLQAVPPDSFYYSASVGLLNEISKEKRRNIIFYVLLFIVLSLAALFLWFLSSGLKKRSAGNSEVFSKISSEEEDELLNGVKFRDSSEAMSFAVAKFISLLNTSFGFGFLPDREAKRLVSVKKSNIGVMADDVEIVLKYSFDQVSDWLTAGRGVPFVYKLERREVLYIRAFPDSHIELENILVCIGIPLICDGKFIGIIYLSCDDNAKKRHEIRLNFERNYQQVKEIAEKTACIVRDALQRESQYINPITGYYNDKYYDEYLPRLLLDAHAHLKPFSLMILEIDFYSSLVEKYAEASAMRLRDLTFNAVKNAVGTKGIFCHLCDPRLAVLLPYVTYEDTASMADKIRNSLQSVKLTYQGDPVTATIALGSLPGTVNTPEELREQVEGALLQGITYGGNLILTAEKKLSITPEKLSETSTESTPSASQKSEGTPEASSVISLFTTRKTSNEQSGLTSLELPAKSARNSIFHPVSSSVVSPGVAKSKKDSSTGINVRFVMEQALAEEVKSLQLAERKVGFIYFGFDNYSVLREIGFKEKVEDAAPLWISLTPQEGLLAKIEENGFAYFIPGFSSSEIFDFAEELRMQTAKLFKDSGETLSCGVSAYPEKISQFKNIVMCSRKAMLRAMEGSGNKTLFCEEA